MKLLLTGAAGYTGSGMGKILAGNHDVRGLDVKPPAADSGLRDFVTGDLADLDFCSRAVEGMDAVVMCHMARNPDGYKTPVAAVDTNVKGTANLYHAMLEKNIKRAVLISTMGVQYPNCKHPPAVGDGPYCFGVEGKQSLYALTKLMQEITARYYYDTARIITTVLRPGWIVYDETLVTKYGWKLETYDPTLIDPRDIGHAVGKALALTNPTLESFNIAQDDIACDIQPTHGRLGWHTTFKFTALPKPKK